MYRFKNAIYSRDMTLVIWYPCTSRSGPSHKVAIAQLPAYVMTTSMARACRNICHFEPVDRAMGGHGR